MRDGSGNGDLARGIAEVAVAMRERMEVLHKSKIHHLPKPKKARSKAAVESIETLLTSPQTPKLRLLSLQQDTIGDCTRCKLCSGRNKVVFGVGNPEAELVFVGEAPGADEDMQGEPFVGRAGKLLTKMIEAMGYTREQVYICNVVKCRPPENRDPEPDEVEACEPFLKAQLAIIKPKVIVALGRYACQCLIRTTEPMGKIRGKWTSYEGISLMPTFHPAYLLRSPSKKREVWEDLQLVIGALGKKV
jgi:uracil-DNA glycosylase family 4